MSTVNLSKGGDDQSPKAASDIARSRAAYGKGAKTSDGQLDDWGLPQKALPGAAEQAGDDGGHESLTARVGPPRNPPPKERSSPLKDESFASMERRRIARAILNSPELLMMAAMRDEETIPSTRLKYRKMLCGVEDGPPTRQRAQQRRAATQANRGSPSRGSSASSPHGGNQQRQKKNGGQDPSMSTSRRSPSGPLKIGHAD